MGGCSFRRGCLAAVEPADRHIVGGRCIVFACRFPICSFHLFKVDRFMSLASVREFLAQRAPAIPVIEMETSTATVELAVAAHGRQEERRVGTECVSP